MFFNKALPSLFLLSCLALSGCSSSESPSGLAIPAGVTHDGSLRIAALDYNVGDLSDPAELAKLTRADLVVLQPDQFWGRPELEGKLALLRNAKPDLKIVAYFRSKVVKTSWGEISPDQHAYLHDLYQASLPYWCSTTTGDTLMDWPGAVLFDYTNPAARRAMMDVFVKYQTTSSNKFDGVFWDYFSDRLWIAPTVTGMDGEPDMDRDGVGHFEDLDEMAAFQDAQYEWVAEMRRAMGAGFIQIANGPRALVDAEFASQFDGMYYELFPNVGFSSGATFHRALDPTHHNSLWNARTWPRTVNGGPWLILAHSNTVGSYRDEQGNWKPISAGNLLRAVALLTGATSTHFDGTGTHNAGLPDLELDLGLPLGEAVVEGDRYTRRFQRGRVVLEMGDGFYPNPFAYAIPQGGAVVESFGDITIDP